MLGNLHNKYKVLCRWKGGITTVKICQACPYSRRKPHWKKYVNMYSSRKLNECIKQATKSDFNKTVLHHYLWLQHDIFASREGIKETPLQPVLPSRKRCSESVFFSCLFPAEFFPPLFLPSSTAVWPEGVVFTMPNFEEFLKCLTFLKKALAWLV